MRTGVSPKRIATRNFCVVSFARALSFTLSDASHQFALGQALMLPYDSSQSTGLARFLLLSYVSALALDN